MTTCEYQSFCPVCGKQTPSRRPLTTRPLSPRCRHGISPPFEPLAPDPKRPEPYCKRPWAHPARSHVRFCQVCGTPI